MRVLKFGGTSVGTTDRLKGVAEIINNGDQTFVVLSAMSGITNLLYDAYEASSRGNSALSNNYLEQITNHFDSVYCQLLGDQNCCFSKEFLSPLRSLLLVADLGLKKDEFVAYGEIMTVQLMYSYLKKLRVEVAYISALSFMTLNDNGEPNTSQIESQLKYAMKQYSEATVFLTEGFICRDAQSNIANLSRGGSDYTATLIGAAIEADEIQIWSDVDGFHNNDPRYVSNARPVRYMSYDEAAELAYFGAKIMHPSSVVPARNASIPIKLKNTLKPSDKGTIIQGFARPDSIRAIAAKDDITVIRIKSGRMLNAYGFLRRLFAVFEYHKVPIDVITTSEVAVSVTIESNQLKAILITDLSELGEIRVYSNQSVICVVGDFGAEKEAMALSVLSALNSIPIRMISYGGSDINVTLVVSSEDKVEAINKLHNNLLQKNDGKQELVEAV
jgi:aspartate kinase